MTRLTSRTLQLSDDRGTTLTVIASQKLRRSEMIPDRWVVGHIHPIAIIVADANGTHALTIDGNAVELETLTSEFPQLSEIVESSSPRRDGQNGAG